MPPSTPTPSPRAPPADEVERRFEAWLAERNDAGLRVTLWLALVLYPLFAVLDVLVAPPEALGVLFASRAVVTAVTLAMLALRSTLLLRRHLQAFTAGYLLLLGLGIAVMVTTLGGFESPYYAGLNLVMLGGGLLFVWPPRVSAFTHGAIVASYVVPNALIAGPGSALPAVTHLFFLVATAIIVVAAQRLVYERSRQALVDRLTLEHAQAELQEAHQSLQELNRYKSEVYANLTHELKTPLAAMLSLVELALDGRFGPVGHELRLSLRRMLRQGVELLKLIADLLELARLDEARLRLQCGRYDLEGVVRAVVSRVDALAERKGVALQVKAEALPPVWFDRDHIERVVANLLSNAIKFTPPGGRVEVVLQPRGEAVQVEVADTGPGFPPAEAERLFERMHRGDHSRSLAGAGIGLALCKELITLHGGEIEAASPEAGGARFRFRLPLGSAHLAEHLLLPEAATERPPWARQDWVSATGTTLELRLLALDQDEPLQSGRPAAEATGPRPLVLVVEDTPELARIIEIVLEDDHEVLLAAHGEQALELLQDHTPDLVLTDWMMPRLDGLELTRRLRATPEHAATPVILLSAREGHEERAEGQAAGVDDWLTKPFTPDQLLAVVRRHLKRSSAEQVDTSPAGRRRSVS